MEPLLAQLWGGLIGAAWRYSQDDDEPPGNKVFAGAVKGVLPGGLVGYGLGYIKVVIPINGSMSNYNKHKYKLEKRINKSRIKP
jgi:hypothetical protein